jgi:hypothetical protein
METKSCEPKVMPKVIMDPRAERRMAALLTMFLLPMIAIAVIAQRTFGGDAVADVVALGDLSAAHIVEIRDEAGAVVLSGEFRTRVDGLGNTEKDADLANQRGEAVIGEVELELPARGREHLRPELEVDVIRLQPRQSYVVVIDDRPVGRFVTDDRGSADFELQESETLPDLSRP